MYLGMKRVNAIFEPKDQNLLQKRRQVEVTEKMLEIVAEDPTCIKCIITGDETMWVYEYDVVTVQQSPFPF